MKFQTRTKSVYSDSENRATLCACSRSARFTFRMKSIYSFTLRSAQMHPPRVIAAICKKTLNCGVNPR
jgi:hypothetical protein